MTIKYDSNWKSRALAPEEVTRDLKSGMKIFIHGAAATPTPLIEALCNNSNIDDITLYHLHTAGPCRFTDPDQTKRFRSKSFFAGACMRKPLEEGRADFIPVFLSDIPDLFISKQIPLDVALVQLSPPDRHGFCTLGTSVDAAKAATESARMVIAEINEQMPRTHGNTFVHFSRIHAFIHTDRPLIEAETPEETDVESRIGEIIADLIEDTATLQVGIGAIPNAVLKRLKNKRDLGVHTEMFSDSVIDLVESGVITNKYKRIHPGRITTSFVSGSRRLFEFVHDNPMLSFIRATERTIRP